MVADLLEPGQCRKDQPAALDALSAIDRDEHFIDDRLIQPRLLSGECRVLFGLNACRQINDHLRVDLEAPKHNGSHEVSQRFRLPAVSMALDRDGEAPAKLAGSAEIARIAELHDRPQLVETVLHRGAGHGHSALGRQLPDRSRLLGRRILDELSLVQHHPPPTNTH